jgi:hypothetical protein
VEEIRQHVISQGLVAEISGATLWRWLSSDALRPWKHRSWIFPRDPNFAAKAGPILDLYQRVWEGAPLGGEPRRRKQPTLPLARPIARCTSSMSTSAWVPGPTWQPGISIEQESSVAVKSKLELLPSIGLWSKSWGKSLINLLAASFG